MIYRTLAREGEPCPYTVGAEYRLLLPGLSGKQSLRVSAVAKERLGLVTWAQVRAEVGHYRSRGAWQAAWVKRHDKAWCARHPTASDEDLERRFRLNWARQDCWVLTFTLLEPPQRFLADQRRRPRDDGQYTGCVGMAIDTLPVVDPAPEYVKQAREEGERLRAERRQQQAIVDAARRADRGRLQRQRFGV